MLSYPPLRTYLSHNVAIVLLVNVLAVLAIGVTSCAGKRYPVFQDQSYFIPAHQRKLYVNEVVNLTSQHYLGINLVDVLRDYYGKHSPMTNVGYKEANFILTVYLVNYQLTISSNVDVYGKNKLSATLEAQVNFINQKKAEKNNQYDPSQPEKAVYLRRARLMLTARSDEFPAEPSSLRVVHRILYVKLIQRLEYYFKNGTLPQPIL